jgi:UDP-N-acetylglucosamine--N-acetylmuramyl-(pentapeptide) pyrophosphoryl-undecaprenol N-acetylglucosamine transferase
MLYRFADRICVGFEDAARHFAAGRVVVTGNPVRYAPAPDRKGESDSPLQILVLGGSTGAHRLNIGVAEAFKIWGNNVINLALVHQTGEADVELVRAKYAGLPLRADVVPFIDDVAAALNRADLVVARAGAMTVTDIALAGRPAIFVPYPFHRDHQQEHNARVLERVDAAVIVLDDENLAGNLVRELERLTADRAMLSDMGRKARQASRPDAAQRIASECFELVESRRKAA